MNEIGNEIRRLRKERGMTQEELAHIAGISHTTLWQAETGRTTPRMWIAEKIADALGVEASDILFPKGEALKFQADVDEGRYEDFLAFLRVLSLDGLNRLSADLRDEQKRAVLANEYGKAADLYARSFLVSKRIEEFDPPLATIKLRSDAPAEVTFHREPTEEERKELEEKYPGYVTVASPVTVQCPIKKRRAFSRGTQR